MSKDGKRLLAFGDFELDREEGLLYRGAAHVPLAPKVFQTLAVLVDSRGRLLTKEQLMKAIWPGTFVEEHNLTLNVHTLRKVLNPNGHAEQYIETVPRRGYRFIAPVTEISGGPHAAAATQREVRDSPPPARHPQRALLIVLVAVITLGAFGWAAARAMRLRRTASMAETGPELARLTNNIADDRQPEVSPDGRTVVFASNRDGGKGEIYAMDMDGGSLRNLTQNPAEDRCPSWSPDGKRIAFESDRRGTQEIFIMDADGGHPRPLVAGGRPAWSPDGTRLLFQQPVNHRSEIFMIAAAGGQPVRLTFDQTFAGDPTWSPDGSRLAFTSLVRDRLQIALMGLDGTNRTLLTDRGQNSLPVWFHDDRILFNSNRDGVDALFVMRADGTVPHRVEMDVRQGSEAAWWPDGRGVVFESERDGNTEIYRLRLDHEPDGAIRLTRHVATDDNPAWSPDGHQIAFESNRDGKMNIFVMDADGGRVRNLTRGDAHDRMPAWSASGARIAFASDRGGVQAIYEMRADGSGVRRITEGQGETAPRWSPDDSQLCFSRAGGIWIEPVAGGAATRLATGDTCAWSGDGSHVIFDRGQIYSVPAAGGAEICLTRNGKGNGGPAVSRDGSRIAFNSNRDGSLFGIFLMNPDGSGQQRISGPTTFDEHPAWSPDGRWIAFRSSRDGNSEIYKVPVR
jgi:Tol biopolymer transport system component/DNA-binding winged helix-turn-helix (wHTH) protein